MQSRLLDEDSLAQQAFTVVLQLLRHRLNSMAWHTTWPGRLAAFCAQGGPGKAVALQDLRADWAAFKAARDLSTKDTFLLKLVKKSPFSCVLMRE
eukprot:2213647-Lingulodinium_polyedra.AAC.1